MFKNKEVKSTLIKIGTIQILLIILIGLGLIYQYKLINTNIIQEEAKIIGNIIKEHPHLEEEIIPIIVDQDNKDNSQLGREVLDKYGYNKEMQLSNQHILINIHKKFAISMFILILSTSFLIGFILITEYNKIYSGIRRVSNASEKVVEGDFSIKLNEIGEGDLNILNHQFNQMSYVLENTVKNLKNEKIFLQNMISDISHQLKTPLSSLIMLNDLILNDEEMDLNIRKEFLKRSQLQLNRMEWLIVNLLKVARIEAGSIDFKKEKVNIKNLVKISITHLSDLLEEDNVELYGNEDDYFIGDADWTGEALINIIKNASEHGNGDIKISWENSPVFSTITIEDNGDGIDKKDLPHIFKRFYKIKNDIKTDSIGIGLNLSKLIIDSQGGLISVKSDKDNGSKFIIRFIH